MKGATTPQPLNSFQHQSLLCIEGIKASEKGNIDTHDALLGERGVLSKVTLYWWFSRHASKLNYHASEK